MTETLANGYSSESTQRELSIKYQHDRVSMFFKDFCILVLWTKVASALDGLTCLWPELILKNLVCLLWTLGYQTYIAKYDGCWLLVSENHFS